MYFALAPRRILLGVVNSFVAGSAGAWKHVVTHGGPAADFDAYLSSRDSAPECDNFHSP